ncbi:uncharacterized protein TNCV_1697171 [Trichonephila clavipes]|nr:uncharacterized protein TNCV_1697171 [Trichonephila clavipes]
MSGYSSILTVHSNQKYLFRYGFAGCSKTCWPWAKRPSCDGEVSAVCEVTTQLLAPAKVVFLIDSHATISVLSTKQSFSLRGKNRLRIFKLRLTGGAHIYHCSRRKQKPTSNINKALTGGAQRTSLNQSPGDQSRGFSTADSHWLGTRACDQSTLPIDVQVFYCKARDSHVEAWRVGCHLSCLPRHSTEVPYHTVYERRVCYKPHPSSRFCFLWIQEKQKFLVQFS